MAPQRRGWAAHEDHVAQVFGLHRTITSGNKFFDPGDATSRGETSWPLHADAKYTENKSFSVALQTMQDMEEQATMLGKHFILPVRIWPKNRPHPADYVVLNLYDLQELIIRARQDDHG